MSIFPPIYGQDIKYSLQFYLTLQSDSEVSFKFISYAVTYLLTIADTGSSSLRESYSNSTKPN